MPVRTSRATDDVNPNPPTPDGESIWAGLSMTWTGWDGSHWVLTDDREGVFLTNQGLRGVGMPDDIQRFTSSSPAVAGSRWRDFQVGERSVFWPLYVFTEDGSATWRELDTAFFKTMRPDKTGTWSVVQPGGGETRTLHCRFESLSKSYETDPFLLGWDLYGINLVAEQPFWVGTPIKRSWVAPSSAGIHDGPGVINISPGSTTSNAKITNTGDVPGWMVWRIKGQTDSAVVGLAGREIEIPFAIPAGKKLTVDTHPDQLSAILRDVTDDDELTEGEDVTDALGDADFAPVAPLAEVDLSLELVLPEAGAEISGALSPLYYRAW